MPITISKAHSWFHQRILPDLMDVHVKPQNPGEWSRLQVWNGSTLEPALPKDLVGMPSEEQMEQLHKNMEEGKLLLFPLGRSNPSLIQSETIAAIRTDLTLPVPPEPLPENPAPTGQQRSDYQGKQIRYQQNLQVYNRTKTILDKLGPNFMDAVENYNSSRDMEQEGKDLKERRSNHTLATEKRRLNNADNVINEVMGSKPTAPDDIYYDINVPCSTIPMPQNTFNEQMEPNSYDVPDNNKLTAEDVATINTAMVGARSDMQKFLSDKPGIGPVQAKGMAQEGFNVLMANLFGKLRAGQPLEAVGGFAEAMRLGKESVEAYLKGDASLLGKRLGECLESIKIGFTGVNQRLYTHEMVAGTKLTERILGLLDKDPKLMEASGMQEKDLEYLRGYVQMGNLYKDHIDGLMKFNQATAQGTTLSTEEKTQIVANAVLRKAIENQLREDDRIKKESTEYKAGAKEAELTDERNNALFEQYLVDNDLLTETGDKIKKVQEQFNKTHELNMHTMYYPNQPLDHEIMQKLGQPGMLERMRENLCKDPAIMAAAAKEPLDLTVTDLEGNEKLQDLVNLSDATMKCMSVSDAQKQAWFENMKALLTGDDNPWLNPNVRTDENRLMIAVPNNQGGKDLVSVASLLEGGMNTLENPDPKALDILYRNAMEGNLYFYGAGKDMPQRVTAQADQAAAEQLKTPVEPTGWQWFINLITFGLFYDDIVHPAPDRDPAAMDGILRSRDGRIATIEVTNPPEPAERGDLVLPERVNVHEQPKQEIVNEQPRQEVSNEPEHVKRGLAQVDQEYIGQFLNHLSYAETRVPANKNISLNGEKLGVLVAMTMGSPDLSFRKPSKVAGQPDERIYNDPDKNYLPLVTKRFIDGGLNAKSEMAVFAKNSEVHVTRALNRAKEDNYEPLAKILANGLTQNNKALLSLKKLDDTYTALAIIGEKAVQIIESNPQLKEAVMKELGEDTKQLDIAKAAKNISDMRMEIMPVYNSTVKQFKMVTKKEVEVNGKIDLKQRNDVLGDPRDVAQVCLLSQIEFNMNFNQFTQEDMLKYVEPGVADQCVDALENTFAVKSFLNDPNRAQKLQDPYSMNEVAIAANAENEQLQAKPKQSPQLQNKEINNMENANKEHNPPELKVPGSMP